MIVHQIFGLLGDSEMNELFRESHNAYIEFCASNNYEYRLWNKEMCDELINDYPHYKELYENVRYPIMKVDIIRFIILHKYGGLYADLDTKPLVKTLKASTFIIGLKTGLKRVIYDMEILQAIKGHPYLLGYLDYIKTQIIEKDKIEIYKVWKCRYVYHTTGPHSICRYLKNLENVDTYRLNEPLTYNNSLNLIGDEDFISYPSCSYKDKMTN